MRDILILLGLVIFNFTMSGFNLSEFTSNPLGEYALLHYYVGLFQMCAAGFVMFPLVDRVRDEMT